MILGAFGRELTCGRCGRPIDKRLPGTHPLGLTVGHIVAVRNGGTDELHNLRPEHRSCNLHAGTSPISPRAVIAHPVPTE